MKKIVAIVLAMVMVLGLATTAFAATTSTGSVVKTSVTVKNAAMYTLGNAQTGAGMSKDAATVTDIEKTTVSGKVVDDVAMYVPNVYDVDGTLYIEVAKASATKALKNNGAYIYLAPATGADVAEVIENYATDVVMDKFVAPVEVPSCGDEANSLPYYVSGNDVYYAFGTDFAYMGGQFVAYDATTVVDIQGHDWDYNSVIVRNTDVLGVQVPVSIKCDECGKTFAIVGAAKFDNTWVEGVNYEVYGDFFIVLDAATASAPVAGETVESAKTFDAGIAMYVGMSVMAAAGSAVVLKKKD